MSQVDTRHVETGDGLAARGTRATSITTFWMLG